MAHYGLPAAGTIILAMLKQYQVSKTARSCQTRVWQNLCVFAAEILRGLLVRPTDGNYGLFMKAAEIIQRVLDAVASDESSTHLAVDPTSSERQTSDVSLPNFDPDLWSFDFSLWDSLSEYPGLQEVVSN